MGAQGDIAHPSVVRTKTDDPRINAISLWHVPLTSHETYYMADGKTCATVETVVIAVETDTGVTG